MVYKCKVVSVLFVKLYITILYRIRAVCLCCIEYTK